MRVLDAMLDHCRRDHPVEACGVLAGRRGGDPDEVIRMVNTAASPTRYGFDPREQLAVWQQLADAGRAPLVIYHSHTASPANLSPVDIAYAVEPGAAYLVVSTQHGTPVTRAWEIRDGVPVEVPIEVRA